MISSKQIILKILIIITLTFFSKLNGNYFDKIKRKKLVKIT